MARPLLLLALLGGVLALPVSTASAATPPQIDATWVTEVTATSARLRAEINPNGAATTYRFEYIAQAAYEANLEAAKEGFSGAGKLPLSGSANVGSGFGDVEVHQSLSGLAPTTPYRYRAVATSSAGTSVGPERALGTEEATNVFHPLDSRGWEMVSPVKKNGGEVQAPEGIFGGGDFQAAVDGQTVTYSSADSFGQGAGAPPGSQYVATRSGAGWQTQNVSAPLASGAYGDHPDGVPYRLFSADLVRALVLDPSQCPEEEGCPRGYSLREGSAFAELAKAPGLRLEGASADLRHLVFASPAGLEEWSEGGTASLSATAGAALAAPIGAISADGSRVYFTEPEDGPIRLWEAGATKTLAETIGGAAFQVASSDGRFAFYLKGAHLYRYDAESEAATDLTPSGGVAGMLGASADGSVAYYQDASGLWLWREGTTTEVAPGVAASASDYPPATGTSRVSADGAHLLFASTAQLSAYESEGAAELFLYGPPPGGGKATLACVSCNPTGERPGGDASIPGAVANGTSRIYRPRVLSTSGSRVFFDSSDRLSPQDSNSSTDVYEWEARGEGSCVREGGCLQLTSSGHGEGPSTFIDASADGSDSFFRTDASLAFGDPGSYDVYDARAGGGFPAPEGAISCEGDACQAIPEAPDDPTPGTLVQNPGNPAPGFTMVKPKKRFHFRLRHHRHHKGHKKHGGGK